MNKRFIAWVLMMFLGLCAVPALAEDDPLAASALVTEENRALYDLVLAWRERYRTDPAWDFGWDMLPSSTVELPVPKDNDISREEALLRALMAVCEDKGADAAYFAEHRPFFGYNQEGAWVISLLPDSFVEEPIWIYFIEIDGQTGEVRSYRAAEPTEPTEENLAPGPKG